MDLEPRTISIFRPYALDFALGALWLIAVAVVVLDQPTILDLANAADSVAATATHVHIPDVVAAFLAIIAAVTVPYCIAVALKPVSMFLLDLSIARIVKKEEGAPVRAEVAKRAHTVIATRLGTSALVSRSTKALYVDWQYPLIAAWLRQAGQREQFHAAAAVPSSIMLGAIVWRLLGAVWPGFVSVIAGFLAGALFLLFAVRSSFRHLKDLYLSLDYAVLMSGADRPKRASATPE